MKRTILKKAAAELLKAMDENGYKKCEVMQLTLKTNINSEAELFVSAEAIISEPGADGKSFKVRKDFDLE